MRRQRTEWFLLLIPALLLAEAGFKQAPDAQNPYVTSYQHLTELEATVFGELIKFYSQDTLWGPVHSNQMIGIMQSPVFFDTVSTSADSFWQAPGSTPVFMVDPIFNAPRVALPDSAKEIREAAIANNLFFDDGNGQWAHRLVFLDELGWALFAWPMGEPCQDSIIAAGPPLTGESIFVDGYLELKGTFRGVGTVGASGGQTGWIRLMDDVRYWFADPITGSFNDTTGGYSDMLGIVSEGDVVIANTWANGHNNQSQGSSIIINAAICALNESFTFEDQNDNFVWEFSQGYSGPYPDERGDIYLWGSLAQKRHGYVHRSNHGGTGYAKTYHYDQRFREQSPLNILARHIPVLDPPELDFGEVLVGQTDTSSVTLRNEGGTYIDVSSASVNGAFFSVVPVDPVTLNPGDSLRFEVHFSPDAIGEYADTLTVELYYGDDLMVPLSGTGSILGIEGGKALPRQFEVQVFPNPFNDQVKIAFDAKNAPITLAIHNIYGQQVKAIAFAGDSSPANSYTWQPTNLSGGIYFLSITSQRHRVNKKLVYLK